MDMIVVCVEDELNVTALMMRVVAEFVSGRPRLSRNHDDGQ